MPGARLRSFHCGDHAEQLAEFLLSAVAFTTRVPRQEDVGFDFFCSLVSRQGPLLKAGPFFAVQVKSSADAITYEQDHEVEWITSQENPFLVCVVNRLELAMDVYSTWNLLCACLDKGKTRIALCPGQSGTRWPWVSHESDGTQTVCLGHPIARISASDAFDDDKIERVAAAIGEWVALDRVNIVNSGAGMHWVVGPEHYGTDEPPSPAEMRVVFYRNLANLPKCSINLGRVATALLLLYHDLPETERMQSPWRDQITVMREVLQIHWERLDQPVKTCLVQQGLLPPS